MWVVANSTCMAGWTNGCARLVGCAGLDTTQWVWESLIVAQVCAYTSGRLGNNNKRKSRTVSGKPKQVETATSWQLGPATRYH